MDREAVAQELVKFAKSLLAQPDEDYPEGVYDKVDIHIELDNGTYMVSCPQWKTDFPAGKKASQVGDRIKKLVEEIVKHNDEELSQR